MRWIMVVLTLLFLTACVIRSNRVSEIDVSGPDPISVTTPVRVHLMDGSTAVFDNGIEVADGLIRGTGLLYDGAEIQPAAGSVVREISLAEVAAVENYQTPVNVPASVAASTLSGVVVVLGAALLALAIFGSCPTVYSLAGDLPVLESELFSYSIAPAFQARDVDRLGIGATDDGEVALEIRNEMLETHYIDALELVEVRHEPGEKVYPARDGAPLVARALVAPSKAQDQDGRDILADVRSADEREWSTTDERLARVTEDDHRDYLYLEFDVPESTGDPAIVLRMRNSMLNTVLFYDVMLRDQSFGALDWLGRDINRLGNAMETGLWYQDTMGLEVEVWDGKRYRNAGHIGDQGPIAWAERALQLPGAKPEAGKFKLRLNFVADNWRFDQISLALDSEVADSRLIPVTWTATPEGMREDIPAYLAEADREYLITRPGDSVQVHFDVGPARTGEERTFFLASEGYYIEWMRAEWLTHGHGDSFKPGDDALLRALNLYAGKRDGYREQFEAVKVQVR